jgi:hypothetical protein
MYFWGFFHDMLLCVCPVSHAMRFIDVLLLGSSPRAGKVTVEDITLSETDLIFRTLVSFANTASSPPALNLRNTI